jgi:flagellum-specific peptidoglycan hydrolase FlgJ
MTRLLSFNPEPFESESEVNGALQAQWLATGPASGAGHQPKPELEISPTVPARPRTRRRPTGSVSPTRPSSTVFDGEAFRQRAVQIAKQELARWGNGRIKETDPRVRKTLQDYWKTGTGASFSEDQLGNPAFQNANPWSAAFISWLMKTAGAASAFKYNGYHAAYTRAAIDNRLANNSNPFKGYRISEVAPRVGDLVCRSRAGSGATYDNVRPPMKTHCDIVTEVRPRSIVTVGGNVSDSVAQKTLRADPDGRIAEPDYFAVIRIEGQRPVTPVGPSPAPTQPDAVAAPRLLRQESTPPGTTLYVEIDLKIVDKFGITAPPVTGIFVPDGYRPGAAADLILYLHGFKAEAIKRQAIDQYWNSQRFPYGALREGANASGRNVIVVAPTLGSHSEAKRLIAPGWLDSYLSQVLSALAAYGPYRGAGTAPALGSLIFACHSGGGWPMRQLAGGSDRALVRLRECWGFDCTYNQGDDDFWAVWARAHPNANVYIYYIAGSPTARLAESLRSKRVPNAMVQSSKDRRHNYVPVTYWTERIQGAPFLAARSGAGVQPPPSPAAPPDIRRMTKKEFIEFVGENARRAMAATRVPASVSVAQAILETGWGKHTIGEAKNLFGIKGRGPAGSVRAPTREYIGGKWVTVDADFAKYDSFEQSITDHARFFLRNRRYARAPKFKDDPDAFAREIHKAGYATGPNYAEQLIALMRQHNLYRFDR